MKTYTIKIDNDGNKSWYSNDKLHRENGPAIENVNGYKEWWLNGQHVSEQDVLNLLETLEIEGVKYTVAQIKAALKKVA